MTIGTPSGLRREERFQPQIDTDENFGANPASVFIGLYLWRLFRTNSRSMTITVHLFARARDLAGSGRIELELPAAACVADLKKSLAGRYPQVSPLVPKLLVAVGMEYADDWTVLTPGAEVACFPPVSGG
jgi:molybdopterin synthase sulfur carrier subunit